MGRLDVAMPMINAAFDCGIPTVNIKLGIGEEMLYTMAIKDEDSERASRNAPDVTCVWAVSKI